MNIIQAPNHIDNDKPILFLAGTIDNGNSYDWQSDLIKKLPNTIFSEFTVCNPRRDEWDESWTNDDPRMIQQIKWELRGMELAKHIIFNFLPESDSIVTMLELGLRLKENKEISIICPKEYKRSQNIITTSRFYGRLCYHSMQEFIEKIKNK